VRALFCILLSFMPLLPASEPHGIKMTVRYVSEGSSVENTTYWQNDRRRLEYRNSVGHRFGPHMAAITRCDLGQIFELNLDSSQYTSVSYPPTPLVKKMRARGLDGETISFSEKPTIRIEIKTVDTGERKQLFGHTARHVITTRKEIPLEGSHSLPQESTRDGWYIDLERRISCDPDYLRNASTQSYGFALLTLSQNSGNQIIDRPEFVTIGKPETGFALQEVIISDNAYKSADGSIKHAASKSEMKVTELQEGPLDASVFEVPHGYKRVKQIERNPAPSSANPVSEFWEQVALSHWFRTN
jgi:hypothetical protein